MPNYESQIIAIRRLSGEVNTELSKLMGLSEPLEVGSADHADLVRKVGMWRVRAANMQKAVSSQEGLLNVSHASALKKHGNFSAKQSYNSKMGNMGRIRKDLIALLGKIADQINAAKTPMSDELAIMKGFESALEALTGNGDDMVLNLQQSQKLTAEISKLTGPMEPIEGYNPNQPIGLLTLVLVLFVTAKKLLSRKT